MTARWNIGLVRNPEPPEPTDFEQAVAEWIADCPYSYALSATAQAKIERIVEQEIESWRV